MILLYEFENAMDLNDAAREANRTTSELMARATADAIERTERAIRLPKIKPWREQFFRGDA